MISHNQSPRIGLIEDEAVIRELYQFKLTISGFTVKSAADGQNGLAMVKAFRPELILLDLRMPEMSGEEMLEKLRSEDWGSEIRVIILTNISRSEAPRSLQFLNVDRYVVKAHHTPSQVVQMVEEVLGFKKQ